MGQVQGRLNCHLRPSHSPAIDQNVKIYNAPSPPLGLESATWGAELQKVGNFLIAGFFPLKFSLKVRKFGHFVNRNKSAKYMKLCIFHAVIYLTL